MIWKWHRFDNAVAQVLVRCWNKSLIAPQTIIIARCLASVEGTERKGSSVLPVAVRAPWKQWRNWQRATVFRKKKWGKKRMTKCLNLHVKMWQQLKRQRCSLKKKVAQSVCVREQKDWSNLKVLKAWKKVSNEDNEQPAGLCPILVRMKLRFIIFCYLGLLSRCQNPSSFFFSLYPSLQASHCGTHYCLQGLYENVFFLALMG